MAVRILLLLLSIIICVNLVIIIVSFLFNVNLYKKHGKIILNGFALLILIIVLGYVLASFAGLI